MEEIWRIIPSHPTHMVSTCARVKGLKRFIERRNKPGYTVQERILSTYYLKSGYQATRFAHGGKLLYVHRLMADAFIPNPNNYPQVNHINGVKSDNRIDNLEWCSASQNAKHAYDLGLNSTDRRRPIKLDKKQVQTIRACLIDGIKPKEISAYFKINERYVSSIKRYKTWTK